jgi:hypothetical protein
MDKVTYSEFLRLLADFIEDHPTLPQPNLYSFEDGGTFFLSNKEQLRSIGSFDKKFLGEIFIAEKNIGGHTLSFRVKREAICKRVVTGTEVIPEHYVPGIEGHIEPESVKEIVEWQCDEPILVETT